MHVIGFVKLLVWVLRPPYVLPVDPRLESVGLPCDWSLSESLGIVPERGAPIDCLWSRMQGLFHLAFPFEAAVTDSLSGFKVEAATSLICVHPD